MGSVGKDTGATKITDYTLAKTYITSGRKRSSELKYSIRRPGGETLHEGAAKLLFSTQKEANAFVDRYNSGRLRTEGYRWF